MRRHSTTAARPRRQPTRARAEPGVLDFLGQMRPPDAALRTSPLRAAALLVLGALSLHELRYLIDPSAGGSVWAGEHAYLSAAAPLLITFALSLAVVSVLAPLLRRPARHSAGGDRIGGFALALLLVHLGQETGEGLVAGAGAGELAVSLLAAAAFAIPLALALGAVAAKVAGWLERTERRFAASLDASPVAREHPLGVLPSHLSLIRGRLDTARRGARGPPVASAARL